MVRRILIVFIGIFPLGGAMVLLLQQVQSEARALLLGLLLGMTASTAVIVLVSAVALSTTGRQSVHPVAPSPPAVEQPLLVISSGGRWTTTPSPGSDYLGRPPRAFTVEEEGLSHPP